MKKIITFYLTFLAFTAISQNISNNDFENWASGPVVGNEFEAPTGWMNLNETAYYLKALPSITKTTDKASGTYAANLKNIAVNYNGKDTILGGYMRTHLSIAGKALPGYLKGKIKYSLATGDKAIISFGYKTWKNGIETTHIIGFKSFIGTSGTYIPFSIKTEAYYYYERLSDTLTISIESYNGWTKNAIAASVSSNLTIDSLGFFGTTQAPIIQAGNTITNGDFTSWTEQDGLKTPANFYLDGLLQERTQDQVDQSTDANSGNFALKLGIDPAGLPSLVYTFLKPASDSKYITGFTKFNLGPNDTAVAYISKYNKTKSTREVFLDSAIFTGTQNTYKPFSLKFDGKINPGDTLILYFAAYNPAQYDNFRLEENGFILFDDLNVSAFPLSIENEEIEKKYLTISPNPSANGIFMIQSAKSQTNLNVFDILGNLVETVIFNSNGMAMLDISKNPRGVYFINLYGADAKSTFRIIY